MCTLAVAFQTEPGLPLLVAANRDEALDRPASGPALREGPVPFLAPRDARAGGTWLGLNARGLFVGITNRYGRPPDPDRASRGALVWEALGHRSAVALHAALAELDPRRFNPFHLLYADRQAAFVTWSDGETRTQRQLEPGVHVVTERSFDAVPRVEREARLRAAWAQAAVRRPEDLERLREAMVLHDPETRLGGTCVHAEHLNYGTRSSLLLALADDPTRSRLLWAEGRPCEHPYVDQAPLLAALFAHSG
jgi:uncharacterized protein with NRDE domain